MKSEYLSKKRLEKVLANMQYENALAIRVSLETGLRINDVLSLSVYDLTANGVYTVAEKTMKPVRATLSEALLLSLRTLSKINKANPYGWCFPSPRDGKKHRTRQAVYIDLEKAAKSCGVKVHISPHTARKVYAVGVFKSAGLETAKQALQHDNINTTMLYAYSDKFVFKDVDKIDYDYLADLVCKRILSILHKRGIL